MTIHPKQKKNPKKQTIEACLQLKVQGQTFWLENTLTLSVEQSIGSYILKGLPLYQIAVHVSIKKMDIERTTLGLLTS